MSSTDLVKISKIKLDPETRQRVTKKAYNTFGDEIDPIHVMEDIVCQVLHWGRLGEQDSNGVWYYNDVVWLRRMDDNTVEFAFPGEMQYLDVVNNGIGEG